MAVVIEQTVDVMVMIYGNSHHDGGDRADGECDGEGDGECDVLNEKPIHGQKERKRDKGF